MALPKNRPAKTARALLVAALGLLATAGTSCSTHDRSSEPPIPKPSASAVQASTPETDEAFTACKVRYDALIATAPSPGAKSYDAHRAAFLGRVRGEPVVFVREPVAAPESALGKAALAAKRAFDKEPPGIRVFKLEDRLKHDPIGLRTALLREGYFYADDPNDLFSMVERVSLTDLFDEPTLFLLRRGSVEKLARAGTTREPTYVFTQGKLKGRPAQLLFGDRVGTSESDLASPLHRDIATLADHEGFERMRIDRLTETDLAVTLRYGETEAKAVVTSSGSVVTLSCLAEPSATRALTKAHAESTARHREAIRALRDTVTEVVFEALPFDRPRAVTGPDRDGELRPFWTGAYLAGRQAFEHDGSTYLVYHANGRPNPPEVCVDFVLDSFERTAGSWYAPRGEKPQRTKGRLSFDDHEQSRPRGVIALGTFAEKLPDLFDMRRFTGNERIPFGDRDRFFAFLEEHADLFEPGDILSIQGLKRDDRVHQHAILLEAVDPITRFPYALADQMRLPRRRSWEGIMAEAPKRSLYYRAHPKSGIMDTLAVSPSATAFAGSAH